MTEPISIQQLKDRMTAIAADPHHPLMAAAIGVVKDGAVLFADAVGHKNLKGDLADGDTKYRIASISKLSTAIGIWQLIERGLIDPDGDISQYIGFTLRNPYYPHIPLTVKMVMAHTSSIRDGDIPGSYNIPYGNPLSAFFTEGHPCYNPNCWAPREEVPGVYFQYCNMNYCLLGQMIENVSGQRFDRYVIEHIYAPMGLTCSFNVVEMPEAVKGQVGTLYRKVDATGEYDPANGVWTAQCDDFSKGYYPYIDYSDYRLGTNGSLFGPQGSLRVSVKELCQILLMFCNGGSHNGAQILKPETVERMFTPVWTYDPELKNGHNDSRMMNCYGMGPHIIFNIPMGDRIAKDQILPFAGHTAEAYGLLGGLLFDRKRGNGLIYMVAGTGSDPALFPGQYSSFYGWEEALLAAGADFAQFDY